MTELAGAGVEDDGGVQGDCNAESVPDSNRRAAAKVLVNGTKKAAQRAMAAVKAFARSPAPGNLPPAADMASLKRWPLACLRKLAMACELHLRENAKAILIRRQLEKYRSTGVEGGNEKAGEEEVAIGEDGGGGCAP